MKLIFDKLSNLFERTEFEEDGETELRRAMAVLIVHTCAIDGEVSENEAARRDILLKEHFGLDDREVHDVVADATVRDREATDLYKFTSVLTRHLDQPGRKDFIRMLWEISLADGKIDEYEANLVWRLAELLGVSTRDRINLRQSVRAGLGLEPEEMSTNGEGNG